MVFATDKSARTAVKRPTTVGTDFVKRVGLSDIYLLTPGGNITVSISKLGGLYAGALVYTTDILPNNHSAWTAVSPDDTSDVPVVAIPSGATGVAFICSAVTDTASPRVGAKFGVNDGNVADNLSAHNRVRTYSGGNIVPSFTPPVPPPGSPVNWFDFTDISTMFLDTAGTVPLTADGQIIAHIKDKGSRLDFASDMQAVGAGPVFRANGVSSGYGAAECSNNATGTYLISEDLTADFTTDRAYLMIFARKVMTFTSQQPFSPPGGSQFGRPFHVLPDQIQWEGVGGKAEQIAFYEPNLIVAGWVRNTGGTDTTVSLNIVAGTDTASYGFGAITNDRIDLCGTTTVSQSFDGFLFETLWYDVTLPSEAELEQYVIDKYSLIWA